MEFNRIYSIHDQAITFEFASIISEDINKHVISLQKKIESNSFEGFIECVPAYSSLTVYYNNIDKKEVIDIVSAMNASSAIQHADDNNKIITIPVCYELGEDLEAVSSLLKIKKEEIIQLHSNHTFRVYMIGFTPGFPYMGILPKELELPRKKTPSLQVPAGSVAIAGNQTGIYPFTTPGGWHIIGRTPLKMFDKEKPPYSLLKAGDHIYFQPISLDEFKAY